MNEIKAMIAAGIDKKISEVNHLILDQQKQIRHQELMIAELQDRFTKMHDEKTVADINSLDVRITQLHTDLRNIKFLKEGSSWDSMFQSISQEVGTLSNSHAHLVTEVQQFQKMLSDITPSLDARFADHSNSLDLAEQQFSRDVTELGAQLQVVESQLNGLLHSDNPNDDDIKMLITMINAHESNMTKLRVDLRAVKTQIAAVSDKDKGGKIHESLASLQVDVSNLSSIVGGIKTTVNQQSTIVSGLEHSLKVSNIGLRSEIESLSGSIISLQDLQQKSAADLIINFGQWESQLETLNKESKGLQQNLSSTVQLVQNDLAATTATVSHLKADVMQLKRVHGDHQEEILAMKKTPFIQDPHLSPDSRLLVSQLSEETNLLKNEFQFLSSTEDEQSQQTLEKMNQMIQALAVNVANIQRSIVEDGDVVSQVTLRHLSSLVGDVKHVQQQLDDVQVTGQLSSEAEHWENAELNLKKLSNKLSTLRNEVDSIALLRTDLDSVMMDELPQLRKDVLSNRRDLWLRLAMISKEYNASVGKLDTKFTALQESYSSAQISGTISSGEILSINGKITALQSELNALKEIQEQLENMKSTLTDSQKEVMTQKQRLNKLENQISTISNLEIPVDLNNKLSAIGEVQQEISHDMSKFKVGIKEIEKHFHVPGTNKWIDISLLNEHVGALDVQIEAIQKDLVISSTGTGDVSKQPSGLDADLLKLQEDIVLLNTVLGVSSDSNQGGTLVTLQQRLAVLEDSISGEEKNTQFAVDVSKASEDVILLRSSIEKLSTSVSAVEKVVSAANLDNLQSDVTNLKTIFQQLQLDLTKCCKNGSAMAALFMADESSGILDFLMSRFVGRDELDLTKQKLSAGALNMNATDEVNLQIIRNIVNDLMLVNNADKTGMVDFALESAGGSIINTRCSKTYSPKTGLLSIFGIPLWYSSSSPRMVIQPDMNPGNCWAFVGTQGYVVIQLSNFVKITSFSMEHIPKSLSPTGNIDSAPNNFSVVGLAHEYDSEGTELGRYNYDQNGSPIQFFGVQKSNTDAFRIVELRIHSNHGNIEYTCLYRFRVHGILQK
ncbi:protein MLP1-like [Anneissia japonica]|uniref:protein MLP1-like n=1 Tax=Anneissia japonica TaxID=1529436 RepID=UPI0014256247|nr:protein MLP1-like [Anneissia japonica]